MASRYGHSRVQGVLAWLLVGKGVSYVFVGPNTSSLSHASCMCADVTLTLTHSHTFLQQVRSWPSGFQEQLLTVLDGHAKHGGRDGGVTAMAVTREEDNKPYKPVTR